MVEPGERGPTSSGAQAELTRGRLLDIGEVLFAEKGFEGTGVRDITTAAGSNVAAVSYHFGGKEGLYQEVFRRRIEALRDLGISRLEDLVQREGLTLSVEMVVACLTAVFVEPVFEHADWQTLTRLFAREMLAPRLPRGMLRLELVEPIEAATARALCLVEPGLDEAAARLSTFSLVAQLLHVVHARSYLDEAVEPWQGLAGTDSVFEHINLFTAGAIRSLARGGAR